MYPSVWLQLELIIDNSQWNVSFRSLNLNTLLGKVETLLKTKTVEWPKNPRFLTQPYPLPPPLAAYIFLSWLIPACPLSPGPPPIIDQYCGRNLHFVTHRQPWCVTQTSWKLHNICVFWNRPLWNAPPRPPCLPQENPENYQRQTLQRQP